MSIMSRKQISLRNVMLFCSPLIYFFIIVLVSQLKQLIIVRSKISFETLHEKLYDKKQSSYSEGPVVSFEGVNTEENV